MGWLLSGAVVAFLSSLILTGAMRRYALRANLMDVPNVRSSHQLPTPRGGGMAVVVVVLVAMVLLWSMGSLSGVSLAALGMGGLAVAGIGYLDDHGHVPARWRFLTHLLAAIWVLLCMGGLPDLQIAAMTWQLGWVGGVIAVIAVVWILNLYNFMDGIDGIAGVEAVTVGLGAAGLLWLSGAQGLAMLALVMAASGLGFLVWNLPPARIFMGDAGSGFIGFVFGALMLVAWAEAGVAPWPWLILLGVFVVDASVTLVRRMARGERWYAAHRSHAYQWAARRFDTHGVVTAGVGLINVLWLWPLAWLAFQAPAYGLFWLLLAWGPLVIVAVWLGAGRAER